MTAGPVGVHRTPADPDATAPGTGPRPRGAVATLLASCLAAALITAGGVLARTDASEGLTSLVWLAGWVSAGWAALAVVVCGVSQYRATRRRRHPAWWQVAFLVLSVLVLVGAAAAHPLIGSGSGSA